MQKLSNLVSEKNQTGTFLFHGPPSVGKRTVAFETCRYLLCLENKSDSCDCRSCRHFNDRHPDFLYVGQDGIRVADADLILDFCSKMPFLSNKKTIVLDNADDISWEAANRLLKTIEEPPDNFCFFIITSNPQVLLPTILSRCIKYEFGMLSQEDVVNILWQKLGYDPPKARVLGWISSGSTIDIFSQAGTYLKLRDMAHEFISNIRRRDVIGSMDYIDKIERSNLNIFVDMIVLILTDIMFIQNNVTDIANVDLKDGLESMSKTFNPKMLVAATSIFSQAKKNAHLNINLNLNLKNILIKTYPLLCV